MGTHFRAVVRRSPDSLQDAALLEVTDPLPYPAVKSELARFDDRDFSDDETLLALDEALLELSSTSEELLAN